ncbi:hypothetical protein [Candidatus Clostridium stratigraminis]|uniref:BofC C-terminal domain-containing protein n=1 Tax=Candidatus Clostridium stratigraminis TaxID=3381661 RepID=A0ABW8T5J8_9CLOT
MSKKKISLLVIVMTFILIGIFYISYNIGFKKLTSLNNRGQGLQSASDIDKLTLNSNTESVISQNAKVILKIEYEKSGDIDSREMITSDFAGKTKEQLEAQGYEVENITKTEAVLLKKVNAYAPNKYILGVNGNCFAIFKTDANSNLYIENEDSDITNIKVPTQGDYNLLVKGSKSFQFNTREEAEEKLGEFNS